MKMKKKQPRGSTIVSVIAGFAVLMIACGMFYTAISMSWNMLSRALEIRERVEQAVWNYYTAADQSSAAPGESLNFGAFRIQGAQGRIYEDSQTGMDIYYYCGN